MTGIGLTGYLYDANGNMLSGAGRSLVWDTENKPSSITRNGVTTTFVYDGDGSRVKKTVGSETTVYVNRYCEVTGSEVTTNYYLGNKLIAVQKGDGLSYIHQDHLGSTSVTSYASGGLESSIAYLPFGDCRNSPQNLPTDKLFTGQRLDSTGLYYYNARYYDPEIGRFISPDTMVQNRYNPQALNPYSYVLNNPLKYTDPTGNFAIVLLGIPIYYWIAAGGLAVAYAGYLNWANSQDWDIMWSKSSTNPKDMEKEKARREQKEEADRRIHDRQDNPEKWEPEGPIDKEPATGKDYKGGTSNRQLERNRETGDSLEHHWIEKGGKVVHENWKLPPTMFVATLAQLNEMSLSTGIRDYQQQVNQAFSNVYANLGANQMMGWSADRGYHAVDTGSTEWWGY